ncbi:N-acetyl sugar amidotransferase, partial [Flavobacteriaceae bacterium]|nr:N-acetyl sugar amidotransferase [Flavobacteriaceae bacterium]
MKKEYQTCKSCVMDTSDTRITFDEKGVCDHCKSYKKDVEPFWFPNDEGKAIFSKQVKELQRKVKDKEFDSIIGLSGGLDSSYLLHMAVNEFGLRPLVFHVDGGWNTDLAVSNIEKMVKKLGLELYVEVINWEEMKDFQLAWFKSGTPHLDIAQDHAYFATMFHFARKYKIDTILNGGNISTECVRNPLDWIYYGTDMTLINDIRKKFSTNKMETYPWSSIYYHKIYLKYFKKIKVLRPLNLMPYNKKMAIDVLSNKYDWTPYPQKHFESRFTKFYEGYWMPTRFGYDTRKVQFSSLILTGQMTREEALKELEKSPYNKETINEDIKFIANKLEISV